MIEQITTTPAMASDADYAIVELDEHVRIPADDAQIDGSDNLTLFKNNESVAHVKVNGVPLEVPNNLRRTIEYGETATWD